MAAPYDKDGTRARKVAPSTGLQSEERERNKIMPKGGACSSKHRKHVSRNYPQRICEKCATEWSRKICLSVAATDVGILQEFGW